MNKGMMFFWLLLTAVAGCSGRKDEGAGDGGGDAFVDAAQDAASDAAADGDADGDGDADSGGDAAPDGGDAGAKTWPGEPWYGCTAGDETGATVVTVFDQADQYWGTEDKRTIDTVASLPQTGAWTRIDLRIELGCPANGDCDNWDRFANVSLVENPGTATEQAIEMERYITPYNIGMCMLTDVTRFAPLLKGERTFRSFIDTWVGPGDTTNGQGWRVTVKLLYRTDATGETVPDELVQLWPFQDVEVGDPSKPIAGQIAEQDLKVAAGVTRAELRVLATGHGQGNRDNCAEFCDLLQSIHVNETEFKYDPFRLDCDQNPIGPEQAGTWTYQRLGWCPGAYVIPHVFDVTQAITAGASNAFTFQVLGPDSQPYENTCRPDAGTADNLCTECAFDDQPGNCDYNGSDHTAPVDKVSVQLLLYR